MKLIEDFPNYFSALEFMIGDKNPSEGANKKNFSSYMVPLASPRGAFDYYEMERLSTGKVEFKITTMHNFKTIVSTSGGLFLEDLDHHEWVDVIMKTGANHFPTTEYNSLRSTQNFKNKSGCASVILMFLLVLATFL